MPNDGRRLRRQFQAATTTGTPLRVALATVSSATTGVAQVSLDGSATTIPAFIPVGLTLATPNVVLLVFVGSQTYVLDRYS